MKELKIIGVILFMASGIFHTGLLGGILEMSGKMESYGFTLLIVLGLLQAIIFFAIVKYVSR